MSDAAATHTNGNGAAFADTPEYRSALLGGPIRLALLVGVGGLIVWAVLAGIIFSATLPERPDGEPGDQRIQELFLSYLTGFVFWMIIGFGSVFFLCVGYVTGGRWAILLRRSLEANAKTLILGFVLFIPVAVSMAMGTNSIYWWARHDAAHGHAEAGQHTETTPPSPGHVRADIVHPNTEVDEEAKIHDYLFPAFAIPRGFIYIAIYSALVWFWLWRNARIAEYDPDLAVASAARNRQKYPGSVGLFVFALTLTFIATDWVMSLDATFNASMFPVIMFDNAAVTSYSIGLLLLLWLKRKGDPRFQHLFPPTEQIHLGSLLLAFTLAWAYFNFSQFMLIWIGNLPEEIPYYLKRTREGWGWYAALAVIVHFPIPFLLLLFRRVKSNPVALRNIAIMLLTIVFVDVMWWVAPSMTHVSFPKFYWLMDVAATVAVGGFWVAMWLYQLKKHPLLPTREVYLLEAYHHGH
jgi:hypothetical protein